LTELEGRTLLSTFTAKNLAHDGNVGTMRPASDTLAPDQVGIRNNTVHWGSGLSGAHDVTDARRVHSRRAATGTIISQTFNDTKSPPQGWVQFTQYGTVAQSPKTFLTITDTSGSSAGIMSTAKTVPFNPVGVMTKMTAQISQISSSPLGNAVFGLLGLNGTALVGELAAGIDAQGNVFAVVYDPAQKISQPTIVPVGVDKGYTGGAVTMTFSINSTGVQITAGSTTFPMLSFSKDLDNFSLNTAFPKGAIPALVAASQPKQKGGAASFQSINVSTGSGGVRPTGLRAHRGGTLALG
jgi:hypothetical protein